MGSASKSFSLAITAVSVAVVLIIAFAWVGPGVNGISSPAAASVLFDEDQVQQIYDRVSPAVVEVMVDTKVGDAFSQEGFGSGFLIDREGHIATNNHVVAGSDRVRVSFP